ncbi:MAG TPA: hypothetical protein ENI39_02475 [Anaerolineae bacterium]|nr:hypothetical protein [Anaerolineae bacterium]
MAKRVRGHIKWFSPEEHFGSIRPDDGSPDILVFLNNFRGTVDPYALRRGNAVEYRVERTPGGQRAVDVVLLRTEAMIQRVRGHIKWFSYEKRYGFIQRDDGLADVFVHLDDLRDAADSHRLAQGDVVEFRVEQTPRGPRATDVVVLRSAVTDERVTGRIKWFNHSKRYGFIQRDDGLPDVFVHISDLRDPADAYWVAEGDLVEFRVVQSPKGPKTVDVVLLPRD